MSGLSGLARADVVAQIADRLSRLPPLARVAVDGVDAAGKTTLADELAHALAGRGVEVVRISADDFLRPPAERYRRGRESPDGYYLDSFDDGALRAAVGGSSAVTLVDGIFLFRPELDDLWDFRIFVHVELEEAIRRGVQRDAARHESVEAAERLYRLRYAPAQRSYLDRERPHERADVVLDNAIPEKPRLVTAGEELPSA